MKAISILTIAACAAGLAACGQGGAGKTEGDAAAPAAAAALEGPAPGLWRLTTTTSMQGAPAMPPQEVCITQSTLEPPANSGAAPGADCTDATFRREGDAMVSAVTCTAQGTTTTVNTRVSGDFSSRYTMVANMKMDPAPVPSMAEITTTTTAERIGDCPAAGG